jgi:hypothetical protein
VHKLDAVPAPAEIDEARPSANAWRSISENEDSAPAASGS